MIVAMRAMFVTTMAVPVAMFEGVVLSVVPSVATTMAMISQVSMVLSMVMSVMPSMCFSSGSKGAHSDDRERK